MDISFVILTWNSEKYIETCLNSIFADLKNTSLYFEIFIVDNGSKDKSVHILNSFKEKYTEIIKPIFLNKNMGTTYPRNLALKKSTGNFIVIMDSDVEITEGTTSELTAFLEKNRNAGIVAPRLNYPDGKLQKSTDTFPTVFTKIYRYFFLKSIEKKEAELKVNSNIQEVDYAISALWFFRRDVLDKVGLLDENIFYAPEDVDFCLSVWMAGFKVFYYPKVISLHHTQEISRGLKFNKAIFNHIIGLIYYFSKHKYMFSSPFNHMC
jgi:GT2 family glycosyltransferase